MTLSQILEIENASNCRINLLKEGMFWRVYQKSAYLFIKQIKDLKAIKRFYKVVNREVVYAGFPDTIFHQLKALVESKGFKLEKSDEKYYIVLGIDGDNGFEQWFQSLAVFQKINSATEKSIIQKIKTYPVHNKTPLETVQFVAELQIQLTTGNQSISCNIISYSKNTCAICVQICSINAKSIGLYSCAKYTISGTGA